MTKDYSSTALTGLKEISAYSGYSERKLMDLIRHENFPAVKVGGRWESDLVLIDKWRTRLIEERLKTRPAAGEAEG